MSNQKQKIELKVEGMSCSGCANTVAKMVKKYGGEDCFVDFTTGDVSFIFDSSLQGASLKRIIDSINGVGYRVTDKKVGEDKLLSALEIKFIISLLLTIPLLVPMVYPIHFLHQPVVQAIFSTPVFIIGFLHFGKSILRVIKTGTADMDLLIFIGIVSSYCYSLAGSWMFSGTPEVEKYLFFETSATISTLVLLGNVIERWSVKRTSSAIRELAASKPHHAKKILQSNGKEAVMEVEAASIIKDDLLLVNTGDRIPADGTIVAGKASVSEAMITGENIPIVKSVDDKVYSGTLLVSGNIRVKAEAAGIGTLLDRILQLVKDARSSKPAIHRLADKVSALFVPLVIVIAAGTFLISFFILGIPVQTALMNSLAALVIACPCAMGLATPTAVMVGLGRAAQNGIVFKGGEIVENFSKTSSIIFDKTGTLTTGLFRIKKIAPAAGFTETDVAEVTGNLEKFSSHPIARSIVKQTNQKIGELALHDVHEEPGLGISGVDADGNIYRAGTADWTSGASMEPVDSGVSISVSKNKILMGTIILEDEIISGAREAMEKFRQAGVSTLLLSGDNEHNCRKIAGQLGISRFFSKQTPESKLKIINDLSAHEQTAMVGDGINDAPALAKAGTGISFGNATDIAIRNAQIVIVSGNNLLNVYRAYEISRKTVRTIKQNLFWALFYNVLAIPVAAAGYLNPMIAAFSMAFSDVIVIGNSLRLKTSKF